MPNHKAERAPIDPADPATAADLDSVARFLAADPTDQRRALAKVAEYGRGCLAEQKQRLGAARANKHAYRSEQRNESKAMWMMRQVGPARRAITGCKSQGRSREAHSGPTRSRNSRRSTQRARSPSGSDPHLARLPIIRRRRGAA
jgi:hypothetical protein